MDSITGSDVLSRVSSLFSHSEMSIGVMIVSVVIGIALCLFGLKVTKILAALVGFVLGAGIGVAIGNVANVEGFTYLILIFGCAIVCAVISFFVYKIGIFLVSLVTFFSVVISVLGTDSSVYYIIAFAVGLVIAILAVIFMEPMVIVVTSIWGGLLAGGGIAEIASLAEPEKMGYVIGGVIAIIGMIIQFIMYTRKISKKDKLHRKATKAKKSRETDVEKARNTLDEDMEEDEELDDDLEDEIVDDYSEQE